MTLLNSLINSLEGAGVPFLALLGLWATVALGFAWLVVKLLVRASSSVRYCVWQFALTGLLFLPVLVVLLPGIPLGFSLSAMSRQLATAAPKSLSADRIHSDSRLDGHGDITHGAIPEIPGEQNEPVPLRTGPRTQRSWRAVDFPLGQDHQSFARDPQSSSPQQPSESDAVESTPGLFTWPVICLGVWALGVAVHLGWLARSAFRARKLIRGASLLQHASVKQQLQGLNRQTSRKTGLQLLASAQTSVPVVVGIWQPRIVLPLDWIEWSADRLRMVLSHELAHIERRDLFWQFVARTAAAIYWYHPLVWFAVRSMRYERERACDDQVLESGVQPVDYATELLAVAIAVNVRQQSLAGGIFMAERCQLEDRVQSILDRSATRHPVSIRVRRGIGCAAACLIILLGMLRPFSPIQEGAAEASETKTTNTQSDLPFPALTAGADARRPVGVSAGVGITSTFPVADAGSHSRPAQPPRSSGDDSIAEKLADGLRVLVKTNELSAKESKPFEFKITLPRPNDVSLKVYDARGKFVRLLSQKYIAEKSLAVSWDLKDSSDKGVAAGTYTVRAESGLRLAFDTTFAKDGILEDKDFRSPAVLRLDKQGNLYLLDIGSPALSRYSSDGDASNPETTLETNDTSKLFKFRSDGSPVPAWNGKNAISAPRTPYWGGLAVEPDGSRIYLSETFTASHVIHVYDGKVGTRLYVIGGFSGEDPEWKKEKGGLVDPWWLGLNGDTKLYTVSGERFCAFHRGKEGKSGAVWQFGGQSNPRTFWDSMGDAGDTDGANAIYLASIYYHQRKELFKVVDSGDSCTYAYDIRQYLDPQTRKNVELRDICGIAYDGEKGLWVVERAASRILKIADSGTSLDFVAAFGTRGKDAAELQFMAPRGTAVSPDGKFLYVIEDGEPISKIEKAKGQARVVRYKIEHASRDVLTVNVRP